MNKSFSNEAKWIEAPDKLNLDCPFLKATPLRPIGDNKIEYEAITNNGTIKLEIQNEKSYLMSKGSTYEDMCNMDILNEPEVLNNLVRRYKDDEIFTFIGPTLVVVNPYRVLPQFFSNQVMNKIRDKVLSSNTSSQKPHIYLIAGNAFNSMVDKEKKQAIVISGESGAGKTQSTKYCLQLLTSLSHKENHSIEDKILACNPILQAFGNSKTTRNDNSSRFGKYVQIYFEKDQTIAGASINSYLLEKSRVVAPAENQRNFHIFYALIASGTMPLKKPHEYKYLEKSKCYEANGINDLQFFKQIRSAMVNLGFTDKDQNKIWQLLISILQVGNLQFDDSVYVEDPQKPCQLKQNSKKILQILSGLLTIKEQDLEKILLFQKKQFGKQFIFSPYDKNKCFANANTLSKAIYNAIFEFLVYKIQNSLRPEQVHKIKSYLSINILDIFGFENFFINSFEQFCINFTNQKLLKLYNQYVFEREMKILKQDGLDQHISQIKAPTNDSLIETISGKISLFSLINDMTMPIQFKDEDMMSSFQKIKTQYVQFDKINKTKFIIIHSQCNVKYEILGFKQKNQDKVLPEIADIVNNLFQHESKDQAGKTLLVKFSKEIDDLMQELTSSNVHFIRCIKPNEKKLAKVVEEKYMLTQVRYLGVFETIQIRKKTFPSRWLYDDFIQRFQPLFPTSKGTTKQKTLKIMEKLTKDPKDYLLGNQRIYMNSEVETKLLKKLHEAMKKKIESGKKIWKFYKKSKFRKCILKNLMILSKRIKIWRKIIVKAQLQLKKKKFEVIKEYSRKKIQQEKLALAKKLEQQKKQRQIQEKALKSTKVSKRQQILPKFNGLLSKKLNQTLKISLIKIKQFSLNKSKTTFLPSQQKTSTALTNKMTSSKEAQKVLNQSLYDSTFIDYSSTEPKTYERNVRKQQKQTQFLMQNSFLNEKSILIQNKSDYAFEGTLTVQPFNKNQTPNLKKLKLILSDQYKPEINGKTDDYLSPPSSDGNFQIQDTQNEIMNKILKFDSKDFFKKVLRKRTNFFGMSKDEDDILIIKNKPLSKSLTLLNEDDDKEAITVFKQILKISQQAKLQSVFKQVQKFVLMCRSSSPHVINEVLLQLIKQSNTSNQLCSIRILQALAVYLHLYEPDPDFLFAALAFIFKKLADNSFSERQAEYFKYVFKKMTRKLEKSVSINFIPIKYQIMALMCKRIISVTIYLSLGSCSHVTAQSYQTLEDIKVKAMQQLGINTKRLHPELFTFFQLSNYEGISEQRPLNEKIVVWDLVSFWERSREKYQQSKYSAPTFYLVLKLRYAFQCHESDEQSIQLMFSQCFFDYFMGRIKLELKQLGALAACVKKMKFPNKEAEDYRECYPLWAHQKWSSQQLIKQMCNGVLALSQNNHSQAEIKFKFLQVCQNAPLALALTVPTDQAIRLHFREKMLYISENNTIIQQIPIKSITKYTQDEEKFVFSVRNQTANKVIATESASICCRYMSMLQDLVTKKVKHDKNRSNSVLTGL